jgi:hypothetical protein
LHHLSSFTLAVLSFLSLLVFFNVLTLNLSDYRFVPIERGSNGF